MLFDGSLKALRACQVKINFKIELAFDVNKCLKQIKLPHPTRVHYSLSYHLIYVS